MTTTIGTAIRMSRIKPMPTNSTHGLSWIKPPKPPSLPEEGLVAIFQPEGAVAEVVPSTVEGSVADVVEGTVVTGTVVGAFSFGIERVSTWLESFLQTRFSSPSLSAVGFFVTCHSPQL